MESFSSRNSYAPLKDNGTKTPLENTKANLSRKLILLEKEYEHFQEKEHLQLKKELKNNQDAMLALRIQYFKEPSDSIQKKILDYEKTRSEIKLKIKPHQDFLTKINELEVKFNQAFDQEVEKNRQEDELQKPGVINSFKRAFRWLGNKINSPYEKLKTLILTGADITGTAGFVTNIVLMMLRVTAKIAIEVGKYAKFFFEVISGPLAISGIIAGTFLDTKAVFQNPEVKQRKMRYLMNGFTILTGALALVVAFGVIAAPHFTLPALFFGITLAAYIKESYILKETRREINEIEAALKTQRTELGKTIQTALLNAPEVIKTQHSQLQKDMFEIKRLEKALVNVPSSRFFIEKMKVDTLKENLFKSETYKQVSTFISNYPRVGRLAFEMNEHKNHLVTIKKAAEHNLETRWLRRMAIGAVAMLVAGAIFAFPPVSAFGAVAILGFVLLNTYYRHKQQSERQSLEEKRQQHVAKEDEGRIIQKKLDHELFDCLQPQTNTSTFAASSALARAAGTTQNRVLAPTSSGPVLTPYPPTGFASLEIIENGDEIDLGNNSDRKHVYRT